MKAPTPSPSPIHGRGESVDDEIEKELDESLPCGDDRVRAKMLRACPDSQGEVGRAVCPAYALVRDVEVGV